MLTDWLRDAWLSWQLGQVPDGGELEAMSETDKEMLMALVTTWKQYEKLEDSRKLAMIFCGPPKE